MHLCSYVEAAIGETSQDVDPEDGDFQAPWLSPARPFLGPVGRRFSRAFSHNFRFFCLILGPIFGSVFGTHFWAPVFFFSRFF